MTERVLVNIDKFVQFHKNRIDLLKEFARNKSHGRLIFQIAFLGLESLAKLLYLKENSPKTRFVELLSLPNRGFRKEEAIQLYKDWRNSLIHQGFITNPWNTLEMWDEYDICFLEYPENRLRSSTELPPESIIAVYKGRIDYLEDFFKKTGTNQVELT